MSIAARLASAALWAEGRMLPVQGNKIVVSNFYGRGYGDHLKPIVEELLRRENGLDIVWLTAKRRPKAFLLVCARRPMRRAAESGSCARQRFGWIITVRERVSRNRGSGICRLGMGLPSNGSSGMSSRRFLQAMRRTLPGTVRKRI